MNSFKSLIEKTIEVDNALLQRDASIETARGMFLKQAGAGQPSNPVLFRRLVLAAVVVTVISAIFGGIALSRIFSEASADKTVVRVGEWLRAPSDEKLVSVFKDGSRVVFAPGAVARVREAKGESATVLLEKGSAEFRVIHRDQTDWRVNAGPYEIRVVGTVFRTTWKPDETELELEVIEGAVMVRGPLLGRDQKVSSNQVLVASVDRNEIRIAPSRPEVSVAGKPATESDPPDVHAGEQVETGTPESNSEDSRSISSSRIALKDGKPDFRVKWQEAARRGDYRGAVDIVSRMDLAELLAHSRSDDLLLLGDAARLTGRFDMAERAYGAVRKRFAGQGSATTAALAMGRMAFDQLRDYKKSRHWLEIYLNEAHGSSLDREILGRLMEARYKSGAIEEARKTAHEYLIRYSQGPHADLAEELLGKP